MKTCSKCKVYKDESNFSRHSHTLDGLQSWCKVCKRRAMSADRRGGKYITQYAAVSASIKTLIHDTKLNKGCAICGEKEPAVLDFHHIDRGEKLFSISSYRIQRRSIQEMIDEIDKCVVLCSNCHRKLHAGIVSMPTTAN